MLTLLGFGSSTRRGATGWTNRAKVRAVIDTCYPDATIDGASPADGADLLFYEEALSHFDARGLPRAARRCHVDTSLDGSWPAAGYRRNARMYINHKPSLAVGFVSGRVGSPLSSGSASMARTCLSGIDDADPCPVTIYREDGIEPYGGIVPPRAVLAYAVDQMRRLYWVMRDVHLVVPGKALVAFWEGKAPRDVVLAALHFAAEDSRWAPWIEAVIATVRTARLS